MMNVLKTKLARVTYPTGNRNFAVFQAFPAGIPAEDADPFLMLDHFGPTVETNGPFEDPDEFPIGWHPHRGIDIVTYLVQGVGRHADSMGNRGTFKAPGLQSISVGSGIEHAEGGGTPKGEVNEGFQIWVNVPSAKKMDDPRYGVNNEIPLIEHEKEGWKVRVVAGKVGEILGPFSTVQPIQILDFNVDASKKALQPIADEANNCIAYVYEGAGTINGQQAPLRSVLHLDASDPTVRDVAIEAAPEHSMKVMLFSGVKLNQPIAWRGPIVMTTFDEIRTAFNELQAGTFLKVSAPNFRHLGKQQ